MYAHIKLLLTALIAALLLAVAIGSAAANHLSVTETRRSETSGCPEGRLSGRGTVKTPTGGAIVVSLI